jgi:predicted nuclease with TOPRIM domain
MSLHTEDLPECEFCGTPVDEPGDVCWDCSSERYPRVREELDVARDEIARLTAELQHVNNNAAQVEVSSRDLREAFESLSVQNRELRSRLAEMEKNHEALSEELIAALSAETGGRT